MLCSKQASATMLALGHAWLLSVFVSRHACAMEGVRRGIRRLPISQVEGRLPELLGNDPLVITGLEEPACAKMQWFDQLLEKGPEDWQMLVEKPCSSSDGLINGWYQCESNSYKPVRDMVTRFKKLVSKKGQLVNQSAYWGELNLGWISDGNDQFPGNTARVALRKLFRRLGVRDVMLEPAVERELNIEIVRTSTPQQYPGVYMATNGTKSAMHIDSDHSSFITFMCKGSKRWIVLNRPQLQAVTKVSEDELHWNVDVKLPNVHDLEDALQRFPELRDSGYFETEVGPGEALYVPQGSAHCATSVGHSMMMTHNFIDSSPCGAQSSLPFWSRTCEHVPWRIEALGFVDMDLKWVCDMYLRFLEKQAQSGGCTTRAEL